MVGKAKKGLGAFLRHQYGQKHQRLAAPLVHFWCTTGDVPLKRAWLLAASAALWLTGGRAAELLTLVDSNGLAVGPVASIDDSGDELRVVFRVGKRTFMPQFRPAGVDGYGSVYYLTADCSGTPFMKVPSSSSVEFTDPYAIEGLGPTLYVRDYTKAARTRTVMSTGAPGLCGTTNLTATFGVATPVFDFSIYTPPFRIRANTPALQ